MLENDTIHDQILGNTLTKNRRLKIEAVTKMDDCFTICYHKTEEAKNSETKLKIY